jgi:putative oxidoreductase
MIGLHTSIELIYKIPILVGAIVLLRFSPNGSVPAGEMILSVLVLILLLVFLVMGNGPWSYDKMFKEEKRR